MKIAFLYLGRRGGGNIYSIHMARLLLEKPDAKIKLFLSSQMEHLENFKKLNKPISLISTVGSFIEKLLLPFSLIFGCLKMLLFSPDVIYSPMFSPFMLPLLFFSRARKITTLHGYYDKNSIKEKIISVLQDLMIMLSDEVIVLSSYYKDILQKKFPNKRIYLIPHPNIDYYQSITAKNPITENNYLLFIGRIEEEYKGGEIMLSAFNIIRQKTPALNLVIAGKGADKYKKEGIIPIDRWIDDSEFAGLILSSFIVCVPYNIPTPSGVISASFSLGKPVIASNILGLNEQVQDGFNGLLFQPGSPKDLAEKILSLCKNKELYKKITAGAASNKINSETREKFLRVF